jgi:hypothetical protein
MTADKLPIDDHNRLRVARVVLREKPTGLERDSKNAIIIFARRL